VAKGLRKSTQQLAGRRVCTSSVNRPRSSADPCGPLEYNVGNVRFTFWVTQGCKIVNRNPSMTEWNKFARRGLTYERTCSDPPAGKGAPEDAPSAPLTCHAGRQPCQAGERRQSLMQTRAVVEWD
jgi:hypothetical protein